MASKFVLTHLKAVTSTLKVDSGFIGVTEAFEMEDFDRTV